MRLALHQRIGYGGGAIESVPSAGVAADGTNYQFGDENDFCLKAGDGHIFPFTIVGAEGAESWSLGDEIASSPAVSPAAAGTNYEWSNDGQFRFIGATGKAYALTVTGASQAETIAIPDGVTADPGALKPSNGTAFRFSGGYFQLYNAGLDAWYSPIVTSDGFSITLT